jgi:hypothetical protein
MNPSSEPEEGAVTYKPRVVELLQLRKRLNIALGEGEGEIHAAREG